MKPKKNERGDSKYHQRHNRRSLKRAQCISRHIDDGDKILDVGCNKGVISEYLLKKNNPKLVKGIEISESQVSKSLRDNDKFSLSRADICHSKIEDTYDSIVYGAVHHHIVRENGLGKSIEVLQKLTEKCEKQIFFETGELKEGGRWQWQRAIRNHFRTDEEHIYFLLNSIRPHIDDIEVIGSFFIHGFPRSLLRITLKPISQRKELKEKTRAPEAASALDHFVSKKTNKTKSIKLRMENGFIEFYRDYQEKPFFYKRRPLFPWVSEDEFLISSQINTPWAIKPNSKLDDGTLKFPFIEGLSIYEVPTKNKKAVAKKILNIHRQAKEISVKAPKSFLDRELEEKELYNCIDLNPNNFIIVYQDDVPSIYVCDLEPQPNRQRWKNKVNKARALRILQESKLEMTVSYIEGACLFMAQSLMGQFKSRKARFMASQPSFLSIVITEITSFLGLMITKIFPVFSEK